MVLVGKAPPVHGYRVLFNISRPFESGLEEMIQKILIDLETLVPPSAKTAMIQYAATGNATAKLYHFDGDPSPLQLDPSQGELEVDVSRGRKLYLEATDISNWQITCSGYSF